MNQSAPVAPPDHSAPVGWVTALLGFAGGYGNASGYLYAKTFAGFISGNSVLFGIALARWRPFEIALNAVAIVFFLAATVIGQRMRRASRVRPRPHILAIACVLEVLLVAAAPFGYVYGASAREFLLLLPLCLALGMQNGVFTRPDGVPLHTTYMTGTMTAFLQAAFTPKKSPTDRSTTMRLITEDWSAFLIGALSAGLLDRAFGVWHVWALALPLIVVAWMDMRAVSRIPQSA